MTWKDRRKFKVNRKGITEQARGVLEEFVLRGCLEMKHINYLTKNEIYGISKYSMMKFNAV